MKRVLITGMSGTGKSSVIHELAAQGFEAVDLDSEEFSHWVEVLPGTSEHPTPAPGRDWVWREDRVQETPKSWIRSWHYYGRSSRSCER